MMLAVCPARHRADPLSPQKKAATQQSRHERATALSTSTPASAAELDALRASAPRPPRGIVEYRQKNGHSKNGRELMNVRGVGEKNFLKLKAQLSVGAAKTEAGRPNQ